VKPARSRTERRGSAAFVLGCALCIASMIGVPARAGEILVLQIKVADGRIDPQSKQSVIFIKLTEESKRMVAAMTEKNIGKSTELRVDGQVLMKPVIREALLAGVFEISGNLSLSEAKAVAKRMASGAKVELEVMD
jgi:preprotein translocase subunit SecD